MKQTFWLFFISMLSAAVLHPQTPLPHHDPVSYTAGKALETESAWISFNTGDQIMVSSGSLAYPVLPSITGNKISFDGAGCDYYKIFSGITSGTVYYSFLLNITSLGSLNTTGGYCTGVIQSNSTTFFGSTLWIRMDGAGFNLGINPRTTAANTVWSPARYAVGTPLYIVICYEIIAGSGNDRVRLWINPQLGLSAEPAPDCAAENTGASDLTNVERILLRQDAAASTPFIEMDEFRISQNWSDAALPVELMSFSGAVNRSTVQLKWQTATEQNNFGFDVERFYDKRSSIDDAGKMIPDNWIKIGFVAGHGTSNRPVEYSFSSELSGSGRYFFRLKQIDNNGTSKLIDPVEIFWKEQNGNDAEIAVYPNPCNPASIFLIKIKEAGHVSVKIYDVLGKAVATVTDQFLGAGEHRFPLPVNGVSSGVYFYRAVGKGISAVKAIAIVR